ncbi:MAG: OmpA family protein [Steroidobacteraceae bacterium]
MITLITRTARIAVLLLPALASPISHAGQPLPLEKGLVITVVTRAGLVGTAGSLDTADTETLYAVADMAADRVSFSFRIAAPGDEKAADLMKEPLSLKRMVRREDLASSNRINLSWGTDDPPMLPGQTFIQTSAAVLDSLKGQGQSAFVMGINEGGMFASAPPPPRSAGPAGVPGNIAGLMQALGVERHYYRGTLQRVEPGTVPFPVLLDGVRTTVPAVHAKGTLKYTDHERSVEFWWLDEPGNALTLKWAIGPNHAIVTRIDRPVVVAQPGHAGNGGAPAITDSPEAKSLAGKTCRAELHGIYFATGSARLLPESEGTLTALASLLSSHPDWNITIEGHTDNIGSAAYNLDLSNRRAASVRDALVSRFHVTASRLSSRGFGLTRPRESNETVEGRARNRRVEAARACGASGP